MGAFQILWRDIITKSVNQVELNGVATSETDPPILTPFFCYQQQVKISVSSFRHWSVSKILAVHAVTKWRHLSGAMRHHLVWIYWKSAESTLATSLATLSVLHWPQLHFIKRALTD